MPTTTSKGYQYPLEDDSITSYPAGAEATVLLEEARPGVSVVTSTAMSAYTGIDLWDGRIVWNTTTNSLYKYDLGTTTWVAAVTFTPSTTVTAPSAFGVSSTPGTFASYSRGDHNHGTPSAAALATTTALAAETTRAESAEGTNSSNIIIVSNNLAAEATTRANADALLLPKANINAVLTSAIEGAYLYGGGGTPLPATPTIDVTTNATVIVVTAAATNNWLPNIVASGSESLNTLLAVAQAITVTFVTPQGATAYYCTGLKIDGTTVQVLWQGGNPPSSGNPEGQDVYTFSIIKIGASTYYVLGSQVQFAN
jgi:hypothetical protein